MTFANLSSLCLPPKHWILKVWGLQSRMVCGMWVCSRKRHWCFFLKKSFTLCVNRAGEYTPILFQSKNKTEQEDLPNIPITVPFLQSEASFSHFRLSYIINICDLRSAWMNRTYYYGKKNLTKWKSGDSIVWGTNPDKKENIVHVFFFFLRGITLIVGNIPLSETHRFERKGGIGHKQWRIF